MTNAAANGGGYGTPSTLKDTCKVMDTWALRLTQTRERKVYYCPRNLEDFHTAFGAWNPSSLFSTFFC
jgi:hypothetical protein